MSTAEWVPQACTLPTAERPLRAAEFDELFAASVLGSSRPDPDRLVLSLEPTGEVAGRVADLAMRETGCCSFFTFVLTAAGGALRLDISVPAGQVAVLDALAVRVAS